MKTTGIVVQYNKEKGYGFIKSNAYSKQIFIHIKSVKNASELSQGQKVEFQIKETSKGLSAIKVHAGATQKSPYLIFALVSAFLTFSISVYLYKYQTITPILSYIIAINITIFILYGYDKFIAINGGLRVPEWNLHALALLGGSPTGLIAQKTFRHKTVKGSFQLVYWGIVVLQVGIIYWFWKN